MVLCLISSLGISVEPSISSRNPCMAGHINYLDVCRWPGRQKDKIESRISKKTYVVVWIFPERCYGLKTSPLTNILRKKNIIYSLPSRECTCLRIFPFGNTSKRPLESISLLANPVLQELYPYSRMSFICRFRSQEHFCSRISLTPLISKFSYSCWWCRLNHEFDRSNNTLSMNLTGVIRRS